MIAKDSKFQRFKKLFWVHLLVWVALTAVLAFWVNAHLQAGSADPVVSAEPLPDISQRLSPWIRIGGYSSALLFVLLIANAVYMAYRPSKPKKKKKDKAEKE